MNTPTHIITSYALPHSRAITKGDVWSILIGGFIPDVIIYGMFFGALFTGTPKSELWGSIYFYDSWQNFIDYFNSIPLILTLLTVGLYFKKRWICLITASMLIHVAGDIFLHNDDAHRHFFHFLTGGL